MNPPGKSCKSDEEKKLAVEQAEKLSQKIDAELKSLCEINPAGDACRNGVNTATQYVAMQEAWKVMKGDVSRSSVNLFDHVYNSPGAKERINHYYGDVHQRHKFFGASNLYEQNIGAGAKWHGGAEFVTSAPVTGLGAGDWSSPLVFSVGRLFAPVYDWREAAGNALMSGGFENFKNLYNNKQLNPVDWDVNQLKTEQKLLQPIHEKYLKNRSVFKLIAETVTDSDVHNYLGRQTIKGGVRLLDNKSRVEYGCKLLGYGAEQGCKP